METAVPLTDVIIMYEFYAFFTRIEERTFVKHLYFLLCTIILYLTVILNH